ncbi:hypothetical protein Dimus_017917 [Dionaea muscipula]
MAPLTPYLSTIKASLFSLLILILLLLLFLASIPVPSSENQQHTDQLQLGRRRRLQEEEDGIDHAGLELPKKKPKLIVSSPAAAAAAPAKNKTKLVKPSSGNLKNQTKLIKPTSKNLTKLLKPITGSAKNKTKTIKSAATQDGFGSSKEETATLTHKIKIKKLNSTTSKASDSTKSGSILLKKSSDLPKTVAGGAKNKTARSSSTTSKSTAEKGNGAAQLKPDKENNSKTKTTTKAPTANTITSTSKNKQQAPQKPNWMYESDEDDLVSGIKDLPTKLQQSFVPDLQRISTNSKIYLSKANKEMTKGFKPYLGNKYAPTMATVICCAFILIPLLLVSLIINRFKAYFSIQKLVIFVQVYLAIYFSILCISSLVTGLEPLRFFYATSQSTYIWLQVLQTLGYVMYLLLLLMYLVLVFSTADTGLGSKFVGLAQTVVGFAVGLHYYIKVFHQVVLRQPPKTNWKIHGIYATCFLVVCLFAAADRRKKAYLEDGGEEGKKN